MFFLVLLLIPLSLNGMDEMANNFAQSGVKQMLDRISELREAKKVKEEFEKIGCVYSFDLPVRSPLPKELVLNDFWKKMQAKAEQEKDAAIGTVMEVREQGKHSYYLFRPHIAAAALIGSPLAVQQGLLISYDYKDKELAKSILQSSQQKMLADFFTDIIDLEKSDERYKAVRNWIEKIKKQQEG